MTIHQWVKKWKFARGGQKIKGREKNGSLKIRKLDSINKDVDRDGDESDIDESSDSLRPVQILSMHSCSAALSYISFLRAATLASVSFLFFPILPPSAPWVHWKNTRVFWRFTRRLTVENFLCTNWLSSSENPVEGICGWSLFTKQKISLHIYLILLWKCSVTFYCNCIWQNTDRFFSTLGPETEKLKCWKPKLALTCSFQ